MYSKATTVAAYLKELPPDRRKAITAVYRAMKKHIPKGYVEGIQYGMIGWVVPLKKYPKGYLDQKDVPLPFAALASQKNHMAVYLMCVYGVKGGEKWLRDEYKKRGMKLDMGKSCIRFKKLEDVALDVIGKAVSRPSVDDFIKLYEKTRKK
jgi:hypothetical protein